jgi:hypothetical protein
VRFSYVQTGKTALATAALEGDLGAMTQLLDSGADASIKDSVRYIHIALCSWFPRADHACYFMNQGGLTALATAAHHGRADVVQLLLRECADLHVPSTVSASSFAPDAPVCLPPYFLNRTARGIRSDRLR